VLWRADLVLGEPGELGHLGNPGAAGEEPGGDLELSLLAALGTFFGEGLPDELGLDLILSGLPAGRYQRPARDLHPAGTAHHERYPASRSLVNREVTGRYLVGAPDVAYLLGHDHALAYLQSRPVGRWRSLRWDASAWGSQRLRLPVRARGLNRMASPHAGLAGGSAAFGLSSGAPITTWPGSSANARRRPA
jgi:hypothetical protein